MSGRRTAAAGSSGSGRHRAAAHRKDGSANPPPPPAPKSGPAARIQRPTGCTWGSRRAVSARLSQAATVSAASGPRSNASRFCSSCSIFEAPRITQSAAVWCSSQLSDRSTRERPACRGDCLQLVHGVEIGRVPVAVEVHLVVVEARAGERPLALLLAGEQPAGQRVVHHRRDAELLADRNVFLLDAARQQVVHGLRNVGRRIALLLARSRASAPPATRRSWKWPGSAPCRRAPPGPWPPGSPRSGLVIGQVQVVEVQVIGLEAAQAASMLARIALRGERRGVGRRPRFSSQPCWPARPSRRPLRVLPRMVSDGPGYRRWRCRRS